MLTLIRKGGSLNNLSAYQIAETVYATIMEVNEL